MRRIASINELVEKQKGINSGEIQAADLPKFSKYTICNLRGGIGKTTLAFNLSFLGEDVLAVDTCPQGNLSFFYDKNYYTNVGVTVKDMLLPHMIPGLGQATRVACKISATNQFFDDDAYYIPSSSDLYLMPTQMATAMNQAKGLPNPTREQVLDNILLSLKTEVDREMKETNCSKCLIDTSPFFSGSTHLAWNATDALIVPVRTDQQSINSLQLLIKTLSDPAGEFRRDMPSDGESPKIQMVVLTHCTWSTSSGARNVPNQQTKVYLEKVRDIVSRNMVHFTTDDPDNHIFLLDDFLGTGRISSALSKPVVLLQPGDTMRINRVKTTVNASVDKCKRQLEYISNSIW